MIVYDLKQTGLKLKSELQNNCSPEMAKRIALEIEQAIHADGTPLTKVEKDILLNTLSFQSMTIKQVKRFFMRQIIPNF